jgi:hypothetical protein
MLDNSRIKIFFKTGRNYQQNNIYSKSARNYLFSSSNFDHSSIYNSPLDKKIGT